MTAIARADLRPGAKYSWPFRTMLVLAWIALVPQLGLGLIFVAPHAVIASENWPPGERVLIALIFLLSAGGLAGSLRCRIRHFCEQPGSIELTGYLLLAGILVSSGVIVQLAGEVTVTNLDRYWAGYLGVFLVTIVPLTILIADGVNQIAALDRRLVVKFRRLPNIVPLALLGLGLFVLTRVLVVWLL